MLEERVAKIEGTVEQMCQRLNHMETEVAELRKEVAELRESNRKEIAEVRESCKGEIAELRGKIDKNYRSLVSIILWLLLPMWATIILGLLAILVKLLLFW
jgi:alkylhydroperoxidase/carboxymuconolactone decarboxylase family protein YurZ